MLAILHAFADRKRNVAVFEVVVEEPTIEQHTMIMLAPREEAGEYIVRMTSLGHARATLGMHRAVEAVGEWVAGLDEEGMGAGAEGKGVAPTLNPSPINEGGTCTALANHLRTSRLNCADCANRLSGLRKGESERWRGFGRGNGCHWRLRASSIFCAKDGRRLVQG